MPVTATVDKKPDTKLGLSIKRSSVTGTTRIGKISDGGLFSSTDLKEGMKVVSINETRVAGMELNDILEVLKSAEGKVTIVAETETEVAGAGAPVASSGASVGSASQSRPSMSKQISNKSSGSMGPKEYVLTVTDVHASKKGAVVRTRTSTTRRRDETYQHSLGL
jgi:predicted metalloprotease with PDZ domain